MVNCFNNTTLPITKSDWNSWVNSPKRMVACCLKFSSNKVKKWYSIRCQPHEVWFYLWLPSKQTNKKWNVSVCIVCFNGFVQRQDWTKCLSLHNIVIERTLFCDAVELAYNCDFMFHGSFVVASLWFLFVLRWSELCLWFGCYVLYITFSVRRRPRYYVSLDP